MRFPLMLVPVLALLALSACATGPEPPSSPAPGPSSSDPAQAPAQTAVPAVDDLVLPGDCASLVPAAVIQREFGARWVAISYTPHAEDVVSQDFAARGGLVCLWGIPNSGAGVTVHVAERATATDLEQVGVWASEGLTDCSPFLDACFADVSETMVGMTARLHVLVDGFEIRVQGSASSIDPLRVFAREAADNMGYV